MKKTRSKPDRRASKRVPLGKVVTSVSNKWSGNILSQAKSGNHNAMVRLAELQSTNSGYGRISFNPVQARRWMEYATSREHAPAKRVLRSMVAKEEIKLDQMKQLQRYSLHYGEHKALKTPAQDDVMAFTKGLNPTYLLNGGAVNFDTVGGKLANRHDITARDVEAGRVTPSIRMTKGTPHVNPGFPHLASRFEQQYAVKAVLDGKIQRKPTDPIPRPIYEYTLATKVPVPEYVNGTLQAIQLSEAIKDHFRPSLATHLTGKTKHPDGPTLHDVPKVPTPAGLVNPYAALIAEDDHLNAEVNSGDVYQVYDKRGLELRHIFQTFWPSADKNVLRNLSIVRQGYAKAMEHELVGKHKLLEPFDDHEYHGQHRTYQKEAQRHIDELNMRSEFEETLLAPGYDSSGERDEYLYVENRRNINVGFNYATETDVPRASRFPYVGLPRRNFFLTDPSRMGNYITVNEEGSDVGELQVEDPLRIRVFSQNMNLIYRQNRAPEPLALDQYSSEDDEDYNYPVHDITAMKSNAQAAASNEGYDEKQLKELFKRDHDSRNYISRQKFEETYRAAVYADHDAIVDTDKDIGSSLDVSSGSEARIPNDFEAHYHVVPVRGKKDNRPHDGFNPPIKPVINPFEQLTDPVALDTKSVDQIFEEGLVPKSRSGSESDFNAPKPYIYEQGDHFPAWNRVVPNPHVFFPIPKKSPGALVEERIYEDSLWESYAEGKASLREVNDKLFPPLIADSTQTSPYQSDVDSSDIDYTNRVYTRDEIYDKLASGRFAVVRRSDVKARPGPYSRYEQLQQAVPTLTPDVLPDIDASVNAMSQALYKDLDNTVQVYEDIRTRALNQAELARDIHMMNHLSKSLASDEFKQLTTVKNTNELPQGLYNKALSLVAEADATYNVILENRKHDFDTIVHTKIAKQSSSSTPTDGGDIKHTPLVSDDAFHTALSSLPTSTIREKARQLSQVDLARSVATAYNNTLQYAKAVGGVNDTDGVQKITDVAKKQFQSEDDLLFSQLNKTATLYEQGLQQHLAQGDSRTAYEIMVDRHLIMLATAESNNDTPATTLTMKTSKGDVKVPVAELKKTLMDEYDQWTTMAYTMDPQSQLSRHPHVASINDYTPEQIALRRQQIEQAATTKSSSDTTTTSTTPKLTPEQRQKLVQQAYQDSLKEATNLNVLKKVYSEPAPQTRMNLMNKAFQKTDTTTNL